MTNAKPIGKHVTQPVRDAMISKDPAATSRLNREDKFSWSDVWSLTGPPPHPTVQLRPISKLVVAALMVAVATLVTAYHFQLVFGIQLVFGSSVAYLALFLLRGWWGVVVMLSAVYTIFKWGHPFSFLIFTGELVGATLISSASNERLFLRKGRIVWYSLLYWTLVGIPVSYLCHHYFLGLTPLFATTNAFKQAINAAINVTIAYALYTFIQLWLNRRSSAPATMLSVRGLILINSFLLILIPSLILVVQISNYRVSEVTRHINTEYARYAKSISDKRLTLDQLRNISALDIKYNDPSDGSTIVTNPRLFGEISKYLPSPLVIPKSINKSLTLMWPPDTKVPLLARFQLSYWRYCPVETRKGDNCQLVFLEKAINEIQYLIDATKGDFVYYFMLLFVFAGFSEVLAFLVEREFRVILPPSLVALDGLQEQAQRQTSPRIASSPASTANIATSDLGQTNDDVLQYSPVSELSQAIAIINKNLCEIRDDKDRIEALNAIAQRQLTTAGEIQKSFLVDSMPCFNHCEFASFISPAYDAGGDWYDYYATDDFALVVVADVCDKGVGSALFMSVFRSLIRYHVSSKPPGETPASVYMQGVIRDVNEYMSCNHGDTAMFATIFAALHCKAGGSTLTYVCAGHESPILMLPDGSIELLKVTGPSVGLFPGTKFNSQTVAFPPGSLLFAYTDGVTDARSATNQSYGIKRLTDLIRGIQSPTLTSAEVVNSVRVSLAEFIGSTEQFDDITCVCMIRDYDDEDKAILPHRELA